MSSACTSARLPFAVTRNARVPPLSRYPTLIEHRGQDHGRERTALVGPALGPVHAGEREPAPPTGDLFQIDAQPLQNLRGAWTQLDARAHALNWIECAPALQRLPVHRLIPLSPCCTCPTGAPKDGKASPGPGPALNRVSGVGRAVYNLAGRSRIRDRPCHRAWAPRPAGCRAT